MSALENRSIGQQFLAEETGCIEPDIEVRIPNKCFWLGPNSVLVDISTLERAKAFPYEIDDSVQPVKV